MWQNTPSVRLSYVHHLVKTFVSKTLLRVYGYTFQTGIFIWPCSFASFYIQIQNQTNQTQENISTTPNITATISVEVSDESADLSEVSGNPENMTTGEVDLLGEPVRVTEGVIVRTSDCVDEGVQVWDIEEEDEPVAVSVAVLEGLDDDVKLGVPDWVWVCVPVKVGDGDEVADVDEVTVAETDGVDDFVGLEDPDWVDDTVGVGELDVEHEPVDVVLGELEGVDDDVKLGVPDWVWVCVTVEVGDADGVLDGEEVAVGEFEGVGEGAGVWKSSCGNSFSRTFQIEVSQHLVSW